MQNIIWQLVGEVFDTPKDSGRDIGYVPGLYSLVYLIRRYGYSTYGRRSSDQVCYYTFPTDVDGFNVLVMFVGSGCFFSFKTDEPLYAELHQADIVLRDEWNERLKIVAQEHGVDFVPYAPRGYGGEMGEWYQDKYKDMFVAIKGDIINDQWSEQGMQNVSAWLDLVREKHGDEWDQHIRTMQKRREDFEKHALSEWGVVCNYDLREYENHHHFGRYISAYRKIITSWLHNPIGVSDHLLINFLGEYDKSKWGNVFDPITGEGIPNKVATPAKSAGFGVPQPFHDDPDLFIEIIQKITSAGGGDFFSGANKLLNPPSLK